MDPTKIAFAGAAQQVRMLAAGAITAPALLDLYLARIARLDPPLNAFRVVLSESARSEAEEAQRRLDAGERQSLLGVPVAVKDDTDVAGQVTAWGTSAHGPAMVHDGEIVRRLRAAGAVIVGKTNVPEIMIWPFTETLSFGATRNPWDLSRSPGGSSGGTAAAVAARVMTLFDDVDVLLTPGTAQGPPRVGAYARRGAPATLGAVSARVPFQAIFNLTGPPAAVVPWGLDSGGVPMAVQLVRRPSDEATLLSLSAQIEAARPWAARRPAVG